MTMEKEKVKEEKKEVTKGQERKRRKSEGRAPKKQLKRSKYYENIYLK